MFVQAEMFAWTRDIWDTNRMLYQLSYEVKSVRVGDISELSLVPSICYNADAENVDFLPFWGVDPTKSW
jgi:hypothetical protein